MLSDKPISDFFLRSLAIGLSSELVESFGVCIPSRLVLPGGAETVCGGNGGTGGMTSGLSSGKTGLVGDVGCDRSGYR